MNYGKMLRARKRIKAYMRENGISLDITKKNWPKVLSKVITEITGEQRLEKETHPEFHIRMARKLPLSGRDLISATPKWANKSLIGKKYEERILLTSQTGIIHHVDHIIPVKGRNVCGLHVHNNGNYIHDSLPFVGW